jgi:site-specific DNA-methyltransferase (adenine-specific)
MSDSHDQATCPSLAFGFDASPRPRPFPGPLPPTLEALPTDPLPRFHLSQCDAVEWLRTLATESVDLVITDPPYESLEKHRAIGTTTRLKHSKSSSNDWFQIFPNKRFPELFHELFRVLNRDRHLYLFCDAETMFVAKPLAEAAGFRFWKPLVWDKQRIGMGYHYRSRYEFILFFEKGKRKLNNLGLADVLGAPRVHNGYPTEKPAAISRILIEQSTRPGELVIDPFMGSASVGEAALETQRSFLGNDISPMSHQIACTRLAQLGTLDATTYAQRRAAQGRFA